MAPFDPLGDLSERDYRLVQSSFVTLFWQRRVLEKEVGWLTDHGYHVVRLDASRWNTRADLFTDIARVLQFPAHFGGNFDALNDRLSDVATGDIGWPRGATGLALVLLNYDHLVTADKAAAQIFVDIFAVQARSAALFGNRLMCLVQSNDPRTSFDPIGARRVPWNWDEAVNTSRGL